MKKKFQLWPAIDLIDGKPVRLLKGDYEQKTQYNVSIESLAEKFSDFAHGIHVVDLDGAKAQKPVNTAVIQKICDAATIPVEIGGGIRTMDDIEKFFATGVDRVILGTSALKNPELLAAAVQKFSAQKVVVGVDAKDGMVATHGWEASSSVDAEEFIVHLQEKFGIQTIIFTDIATDGTLAGPPLETFARLVQKFPDIEIIASGGVANIADITQLQTIGVAGCIFGKAYYEGLLDTDELQKM